MTTATTSAKATERTGVVTFKGNPLTLIDTGIQAGDRAPEFEVVAQDLSTVTLAAGRGKTLLISAVPSIDTPVCDQETRRFNEEAAKLPGNVEVWTISMDLPFAQKRWCGAAGITKVKVLSDHRDASFGQAYGTLVKGLRLLARAIFVVDQKGAVTYVEYVPEMTNHPNYDAALQAARSAK